MRDPCPVCQGRRKITLPFFRRPTSRYDVDAETQLADAGSRRRDYPCPECSPVAAERHLHVIHETSEMEMLVMDEKAQAGFREHVYMDLATQIGRFMLREGLVRIEEITLSSGRGPRLQIRASAAVVSQKIVGSIEDRVEAVVLQRLHDALSKACDRVRNWGSALAGSHVIRKDDAGVQIMSVYSDAMQAAHNRK